MRSKSLRLPESIGDDVIELRGPTGRAAPGQAVPDHGPSEEVVVVGAGSGENGTVTVIVPTAA